MPSGAEPQSRIDGADSALSLYHLLDPKILANPYPLFHRLRDEAPVHWDPFLHAWVVTRYADVVEILTERKSQQHLFSRRALLRE